LNCKTFSKDLLGILSYDFALHTGDDTATYTLIFSVLSSEPTSLIASNKFFVFL
jgi:hypothetical protein